VPAVDDLPLLLELLEEDAPVVQRAVGRDLAAFGPGLAQALRERGLRPNRDRVRRIETLLAGPARAWMEADWPQVFSTGNDLARMEAGYRRLGAWLNGPCSPLDLGEQLDELAGDYRFAGGPPTLEGLVDFLFARGRLRGARRDFYAPHNSNLCAVIRTGRGVPISLVAVLVLVGARLGLRAEGCGFPGHFLARIRVDGQPRLVDCFDGGRVLDPEELRGRYRGELARIDRVVDDAVTADAFLARSLRNLVGAFQRAGRVADRDLAARLLATIARAAADSGDGRSRAGAAGNDEARRANFASGQLVRHRLYHYRGVVVDADPECRASIDWYHANRTQPGREQPWYHVLVDGGDQVTYVAESNLELDRSARSIDHPLLAQFFHGFRDGRYVRNAQSWPDANA